MTLKVQQVSIRRTTLSIAFVLAALGSPGVWAQLERPNLVDRINVSPTTDQATLVLVANLALDRDTAQMLERKLSYYLRYVETGRLYKDRTGISRASPVVISLNLMVPPDQWARDYLAAVKQALEKRGYEVRFREIDPSTGKLQRE